MRKLVGFFFIFVSLNLLADNRGVMTPFINVNMVSNETVQLMKALAENEDLSIIQKIIESGADVNAVYDDALRDTTIIMGALYDKRSIDVISLLIKNGADVNRFDSDGVTPLMIAAGRLSDNNMLKLLLDSGANLMHKSALNRDMAFHSAVRNNVKTFNYLNNYSLTKYGQDSVPYSELLIDTIRWKDDIDIINRLLELGADPNFITEYGLFPLRHARSFKSVESLIKYGADVNIKNKDGNSALHFQVLNKSIEVFEMLLDNGADPRAVNNEGKSVLDTLIDIENKVIKYFNDRNIKFEMKVDETTGKKVIDMDKLDYAMEAHGDFIKFKISIDDRKKVLLNYLYGNDHNCFEEDY